MLTEGLPHQPLKKIFYRDRELEEFDIDQALEFGKSHPEALVLLDELASFQCARFPPSETAGKTSKNSL